MVVLVVATAADARRGDPGGRADGAVINLVLVPPVHVRTAEQALTDLRSALGRVVDGMSRDVGAPDWPPSSPEQTRALQDPLSRAREAVDRGSESVLLNPSARRVRSVPRRQREALTSLEYIVVDVRQMARTLSDAADEGPSLFVLGDRFRPQFADGALLTDLEQVVSTLERGPLHSARA